ncbi:MAG TPA: protein-L-isoaspartate(D-aspartate) O-methyltransferase [candidate division Zixibacteria bacterium]|nr:protein-L-isoaspartate(D-aspartate) O-methyltransferase [candidate division Zixibacteria bacterium]
MFRFRNDDERLHERRNMVERTIVARGIRDGAVIDAMLKIPRHRFVPKSVVGDAYEDTPLPIGHNQTISQPYIVARMVELAQIGADSKVLEVGAGCGYVSAVLAEIVREVFAIEIVEEIAITAIKTLDTLGYDNIHFRVGDGFRGWLEEAPFDAIIISAAPLEIPEPLLEQLAIGGRLVAPVGDFEQIIKVATRTEDGFEVVDDIPVRFVPMTGEALP